jgi:hypothetical protein
MEEEEEEDNGPYYYYYSRQERKDANESVLSYGGLAVFILLALVLEWSGFLGGRPLPPGLQYFFILSVVVLSLMTLGYHLVATRRR